jgi:hypothetical protein
MGLVISDEDGRAIDLFLDQGAASTKGGMAKHATAVSPAKMAAIENILTLLGQMPVEEPPTNLVARTMRKIEKTEKVGKTPTARRTSQPTRRSPTAPPAN